MSSQPLDQKPQINELNAMLTERMNQQSPLQTARNALIVTRREVRDSFRDWRIMLPIFGLTLVFPFLANLASLLFVGLFEGASEDVDSAALIDAFLPLMPMLVGFFPVSISLVIALETFVGEKERMSLEPLLSTPLTNLELYAGKVLAAIIPPLLAGYLGIGLYMGGQILGNQAWRPDPILILQIVLLTTAQAVVMVTGAVVISSQTTSTRAANLLASAVILPVSLLVIFESIIMIQPSRRFVLWWVLLGLVVVVILLIRTGTRIFRREELLGRAIDNLNLGWAWGVLVEQWQGGVKQPNPFAWYRYSVWPAILRLRGAMLAYIVCALILFIGGWMFQTRYPLPLTGVQVREGSVQAHMQDIFTRAAADPRLSQSPDLPLIDPRYSKEDMLNNLREVFELGQSDPGWIRFTFEQNSRVIFLSTFLGMMTFGVLSLVITALPFGILGFLFSNINAAGINIWPFIMAVLPHGIVEIPTIMLGGALGLKLGAVVTQPPNKMTVGEAWLRQLADTVKIGLFVIAPLLLIAAILEVQLTPRVVEWVLINVDL